MFFKSIFHVFLPPQRVALGLSVARGSLDFFAVSFVLSPISGLALLAAVGSEKTPERQQIKNHQYDLSNKNGGNCQLELRAPPLPFSLR